MVQSLWSFYTGPGPQQPRGLVQVQGYLHQATGGGCLEAAGNPHLYYTRENRTTSSLHSKVLHVPEYLAQKTTPTPLGHPLDTGHGATVGSLGGALTRK